ncbi:hypothetical protein GQ53DRAFT_839158 [Thozetella sp. PMI_491]|nr:hypothetical protein GQ53DRAFT_839158 [Thozetella sp. PMI_491]
MATVPTQNTNVRPDEEPLDQAQLDELRAAMAAAGLPEFPIETPEQVKFIKSVLDGRSRPPGETIPMLEWEKFPAMIRDRLGKETQEKIDKCIGRVLDGHAGEEEWKSAREEGRALLGGEEDLVLMYDKMFLNPRAVQLARDMRTSAREGNLLGSSSTENSGPSGEPST